MQIIIKVDGEEKVLAFLDRLRQPHDKLLSMLGLAMEAQTINHFAEQRGPLGDWAPRKRGGPALVDTGRLRGSISHIVTGNEAHVGTNVFYGKFHQQGTGRIPQRAFLGPTEEDKDELREIIEQYFNRLIG